MGSLIKDHLSKKWQLAPKSIYHLTLMPCFDKKLEASRNDFYNDALDSHDVDMVITTIEVEQMLQEDGVNLAELPTSQLDFCKGNIFKGKKILSINQQIIYLMQKLCETVKSFWILSLTFKILNLFFQEMNIFH